MPIISILTDKEIFLTRTKCQSRELGLLLFDFLHLVLQAGGLPVNRGHADILFFTYREAYDGKTPPDLYEVSEEMANAFYMLRLKLESAVKDQFLTGKSEGANLLFELNNGSITMQDFGERLKAPDPK